MEVKRNFYNCAEAESARIEGAEETRSGGEDKTRSDKRQFLATFLCINKKKTIEKINIE